MAIEVGKKAPEFCLPDTFGNTICLNDYKGKWVVLYFYPKDNTSGCTKEAVDFTMLKKDFEQLDAVILGVSKDKPESHKKFIEKHNLGITLLSDENKEVLKAYGAWGEKKNYGKITEGTIRSTFLIDPEGIIKYIWKNVKVHQKRKTGIVKHAEVVLQKLKELQNQ